MTDDEAEDLRRQAEHDRRDRDAFLQQLVEVRAWRDKAYADGRGRIHPIWRALDAILARQPDAEPCNEYQNGRREGIAWAVDAVAEIIHCSEAPVSRLAEWVARNRLGGQR